MVQPATPKSVKGDFSIERIKLRGENYGLRARDGVYYISETYFTGKKGERRVDYTLGNRRIQQYLTTLEDGRIVVLPPSWDVLRKEWFHNMEIVAPEENDDTPVQVWNKNCFGCHVSGQENHFNLEKKTYRSEWMDFGTTCERCHGPASKHVDRYTRAGSYAGDDNYIVRQTSLDNVTNTMVCAQCHSLRDTMAPGYTAGEDYFDYFMPLLEYGLPAGNDPAWWADGKTRRFSSNALGIWQSECFLKGKVACTTCHVDPHEPEIENNPQLRPTNNTLCTRCHAGMDQDLTAHTHHAPTSEGSSCVECHMPRTVTSIKATMRDHSISIPTPENTIAHGIPNACNLCHGDRSPEWAVETLDEWFPTSTARQKLIDRAAAFSGARAGKPEALDRLVALAANEAQGPLPRANALGYLSRYSDPRVLPALASGLEDPHPLLRAVAAMRFGELEIRSEDFARYGPALASALDNETRIVRMSAAYSLLNLAAR